MYLFYGNDNYLIQQKVKQLVQQLNNKEQYEVLRYDITETSLHEILYHLNTSSMFDSNKIIILKECWFLTEAKNQVKIDGLDLLVRYLENPNPEHVLILQCPSSKISKKLKISNKITGLLKCAEVKSWSTNEKQVWIKQYVTEQQLTIDNQAVDLLISYTPDVAQVLQTELFKLCLLKQHIDANLVVNNITRYFENDVFQLANFILTKDFKGFNERYESLKYQKFDVTAFLGLLASNFVLLRNLLVLKSLRYDQQLMSDVLKVHPYRVKMMYGYTRDYTVKQVNDLILKMYQFDKMIKQGIIDKNKMVFFDIFMLEFFDK